MSAGALALVLLAGLIHAGWNIAAKKAGGDVRFAALTIAAQLVCWPPLGLWLALRDVPCWGPAQWQFIVASAALHCLYFVVLLRGYRKADLTVVYPLARGTGPLLASAVAIVLLGERLTGFGLFGIVAAVGGVFLLAGGPRIWHGPYDPVHARRLSAGLRYGLLTGVFIAGYTLVDGVAVKRLAMAPILVDYVSCAVRLVLYAPALMRDRATAAAHWREQRKYVLLVAIFSPAAYVLVLYAMQRAPLSHVAPAREVSMLFAALLGGQLLGEGDRLPRLIGAALIAFGVVSLALG